MLSITLQFVVESAEGFKETASKKVQENFMIISLYNNLLPFRDIVPYFDPYKFSVLLHLPRWTNKSQSPKNIKLDKSTSYMRILQNFTLK